MTENIVDNFIRLDQNSISPRQWEALKERFTFYPQPDVWVSAYRERKSLGEYWLPRGAWDHLPRNIKLRDRRSFPKMPKLETDIILDLKSPDKNFIGQKDCIKAMFDPANNQQGFIHRQPGSGKSNICLYFCAKVGTRSLVIVHTEDLLNQWVKYAEKVIPEIGEIGIIRQGSATIGHLTIGMLQTLHRRNYPENWWRQFGCVINDECLHAPANTFDEVLSKCTARYRFGVSASETRADNMQPLVEYTFGKCIHDLKFSSPVPVTVHKIKTDFNAKKMNRNAPEFMQRRQWHSQIKRMVTDDKRNTLIADSVNNQLEAGRSVLVLSRRIEHLQLIQEKINYPSEVLAAKLVKKPERVKMLNQFVSGELKCILATQLADEGLDVPILSCVCLTFPAKHSDLILQQVGRSLREYKGKNSAVIIDIVDAGVPHLNSQWHHRRKAYRKWGFRITGSRITDRMRVPGALRLF